MRALEATQPFKQLMRTYNDFQHDGKQNLGEECFIIRGSLVPQASRLVMKIDESRGRFSRVTHMTRISPTFIMSPTVANVVLSTTKASDVRLSEGSIL